MIDALVSARTGVLRLTRKATMIRVGSAGSMSMRRDRSDGESTVAHLVALVQSGDAPEDCLVLGAGPEDSGIPGEERGARQARGAFRSAAR